MADPGGSAIWKCGYVGARTDSIQQTNICLAIHLQTLWLHLIRRVCPEFNLQKGIIFLSLLIVSDVIVIWGTLLVTNGTYFYWRLVNFYSSWCYCFTTYS